MEMKVKTYKVRWAQDCESYVKTSIVEAKTRKAAEKIVKGIHGDSIVIDSITLDYDYEMELIWQNID